MNSVVLKFPSNGPKEVLERTLAKIDRIKSVVIIIEWDNESFAIDHSKTKTSKIALGNAILSAEVMRSAFGD